MAAVLPGRAAVVAKRAMAGGDRVLAGFNSARPVAGSLASTVASVLWSSVM